MTCVQPVTVHRLQATLTTWHAFTHRVHQAFLTEHSKLSTTNLATDVQLLIRIKNLRQPFI